jgi:hypothetical protein
LIFALDCLEEPRVPHLPDDDDFARPLKVLRRRLNGVYREDLGFSGPTRRYVLMVAMLVGLASVPTLAILTTGSSEITGDGRTGAMDVPFLPPAGTGPVRPAPMPPAPGMPSLPVTSKTTQGYGESPHPASSPPPVVSAEPRPGGSRVTAVPVPGASSGADAADTAGPSRASGPGSTEPSWASGPGSSRASSPRGAAGPSRVSSHRDSAGPSRVSSSRGAAGPSRVSSPRGAAGPSRASAGRGKRHVPRGGSPAARSPIPAVPGLPLVPEEDVLPEPVLPDDFPTVPDLPDIPDEPDRSRDDDNDDSGNSDQPDKPDKHHCEKATTTHERSSRRHSDRAATTQRPAGDPPGRDDRSTVHDRRSTDRPRVSRRSAVAERPHNIRPSRTLEQGHYDGNLNVVRRLLTESNSEENRRANRPYRGMHRAEHTNYPEERNPSYDRSTRVGRHHADPNPDAHYINRR